MVEKDKDQNQYAIDIVSAMAERTIKKLWIVIILLIVLFVGSNVAWIVYESQFIVEETTVTQDAEWEDGNVILNGTGEVTINGESKTNYNDSEANP